MTAQPGGLLLGVDAGGSHTVALVGSQASAIAGRGAAGPGNPHATSFEAAVTQVESAIREALASAGGIQPREVRRAVIGVAGAGLAPDRARLSSLLATRLGVPATTLRIVPDPVLVLPAAGYRAGVALIAGTGSSAFGVSPDGRTAVGGGWGYLFGDEGSAYAVGRQALHAVALADDGTAPPTALTDALLGHFGVARPRDLVPRVYLAPHPRTAIADLAPIVVRVAQGGDREGRRIVARVAVDLALLTGGIARRLSLAPDVPVVGAGGLFRAGPTLLRPLRRALNRQGLARLVVLADPPALGALRLAAGDFPLLPDA